MIKYMISFMGRKHRQTPLYLEINNTGKLCGSLFIHTVAECSHKYFVHDPVFECKDCLFALRLCKCSPEENLNS